VEENRKLQLNQTVLTQATTVYDQILVLFDEQNTATVALEFLMPGKDNF